MHSFFLILCRVSYHEKKAYLCKPRQSESNRIHGTMPPLSLHSFILNPKRTCPVQHHDTRLYSFGSGSSGNCYYLWHRGCGVLIDVGISLRTLKKYFRTYGLSYGDIHCILVTHDHTDHVKYVGALSTELHLPVYASAEVHAGMGHNCFMTKKVEQAERRTFQPEVTWQTGVFEITPFAVPHDSSGNNGFLFRFGNESLCLITDAGEVTPSMGKYLRQARNLIIEANYDALMLESGPYPLRLKRRICGGTGHLCNSLTGKAIAEYASQDLQRVWLCHLSEENNHPELARATVRGLLEAAGREVDSGAGIRLYVLRRKVPDFYEW